MKHLKESIHKQCPFCKCEQLPRDHQPEPSLHAFTTEYYCGAELITVLEQDGVEVQTNCPGKKFGGTIRNWQTHTLSEDIEGAAKLGVEIKTDKIYKMTGTVVECALGRWKEGFHMTSSVIIDIDRERGIVETMNTMYRVQDEGGDIFKDMGPAINGIFY